MGSGLCENQTLQNLALARLWALRSARLWAELRRLWVVPYVWILDASDAPWTLQTLQNLALARLWALGSARIRRSKNLALARLWAQTLHGCFRRSKTSHLLDCGLWALRESDAPKPRTCQTVGSGLCETVGGVAQAVGSGRWRAGAASGFWTLQTLQNLALARLWALGSVSLWAELRRLWARGSGAPNTFF